MLSRRRQIEQPRTGTGIRSNSGRGTSALEPASAKPQQTDWWYGRPVFRVAALLFLALAAYAPVLVCGFVWDDDFYVTENQSLRTVEGLRRIWMEPTASPQYYPLVFASYWAEYHIWGLSPTGYHLINVLLHGLNGVLLWRALSHLRVPGAWLAAAIFVLHPVHVESVAWITERKNVLSGFFYLAAALAYFRFFFANPQSARPPRQWSWYIVAFALFVCALLSKTVACTWPAAVSLVLWWKRGNLRWSDVAPLFPFVVVGVGFGLMTVGLEKHHVGATGPDWELTPMERVLVAGRAFWFYVGKVSWPIELCFIYPRWRIDAGAWWQYLFPLGALGILAACWLGRRQLGRGLLVALLFFTGTLFPALGFIDVYPMRFSFVADHFQYLASVGVIVLLVAAGLAAHQRIAPGNSPAATSAAAICLAVLFLLTVNQVPIYTDVESLWRDTLTKNPDCWLAHNNLGERLFEKGEIAEAQEHYREAVRLRPDFPSYHYNLGKTYLFRGDANAAAHEFQKAVRRDPNYAIAHYSLGLALRRLGDTKGAVSSLQTAVRLQPDFAQAHNNLGVIFATLERPEDAIHHFQMAARLAPDDPEPFFNLALFLARHGRPAEALDYAAQALIRNPRDPRIQQLVDMLKDQTETR